MDLGASLVWEAALSKLKIRLDYNAADLIRIPNKGPLIVVANHPFGVVDGLILGYLVSRVRSKFTVLVNEVLCKEKLFASYLLPIDFRETRAAMQTNIETRRQALTRLQAGEALAIFPAGGVATTDGWRGKATDLEWKRFVAKLIQVTRATIVPIYVHGQNSRLFQAVSQFSQTLRIGLLLHEVRNKMGRQIKVSIGEPIAYEAISGLRDRQVLLTYLRDVTYGLAKN
jgi:putative hemolysin